VWLWFERPKSRKEFGEKKFREKRRKEFGEKKFREKGRMSARRVSCQNKDSQKYILFKNQGNSKTKQGRMLASSNRTHSADPLGSV
jgi:hypothetical protein